MATELDMDELKWHLRFLNLAHEISGWSKDPSTKTGCVVVRDRRVLTTGYNGFPPGVKDTPRRYEDRETKYKLIEHADRNAIYQAARQGISLSGATMYLTGPPCHECTKGIISAGIACVIWPSENSFEKNQQVRARWANSLEASFAMLREAGVEHFRV